MPSSYTPAPTASLKSLRDAAQRKFGDVVIDVSDAQDGTDVIVLRHPLRLDPAVRKRLATIGERIAEAQADAPEVKAARQVLGEVIDRRDKAVARRDEAAEKEKPERAVTELSAQVATLQEEVEAERVKVQAAAELYNKSEDEQLAAVRDVVQEFVRDTTTSLAAADRLIGELGDDLTVLIALVEEYTQRGQMGEASPSAT